MSTLSLSLSLCIFTYVCVYWSVCVCPAALNQKNTSIKKSQSGGMERRRRVEGNSDILSSHGASLCSGRADSPLLWSCRRWDSIWARWKSIYTNSSALIDNWKALCSLSNLRQHRAFLQISRSTYSRLHLDLVRPLNTTRGFGIKSSLRSF